MANSLRRATDAYELTVLRDFYDNWKNLPITVIAAENLSVREYIAQFDRDVARMNAFANVLESILRADWRKWDKGLDNALEFERWAKSIAAHALAQSHTAECIDASGRCMITGEV